MLSYLTVHNPLKLGQAVGSGLTGGIPRVGPNG
jgi:hypothetical protein